MANEQPPRCVTRAEFYTGLAVVTTLVLLVHVDAGGPARDWFGVADRLVTGAGLVAVQLYLAARAVREHRAQARAAPPPAPPPAAGQPGG